jgi:preprotein translocase subunit SecA
MTRATREAILADPSVLAAGRPYSERSEKEPGPHDKIAEYLLANTIRPIGSWLRDPVRGLRPIETHTARHDASLATRSDVELRALAGGMRSRLRRQGFVPSLVGECFALIREAAHRTLGKRHYPSQLMAGWGLLQGKLVEMATGEGKTFAATLPVCTVALAGYPVHVITVNDYLASRDAAEMRPLYEFLGLTVGTVVQGMERPERRAAYACSITYCTNKELAFDYLRDGVAKGQGGSRLHLALGKLRGDAVQADGLVLRGLYFAIVDEADSVFIDEARTPLILSASGGPADEAVVCERALAIAAELVVGDDYKVELAERRIEMTDAGRTSVASLSAGLDGIFLSARAREEFVSQALVARILFRRDEHYVVVDGKIQIVDESTGRVMADRSWERGLHQLIEVKEGCETTERRETLARLTYQRLFRRYLRLSGMTGTAREVAREIRSVYGLDVVRIPLHRPSRRVFDTEIVCATRDEKWRAVANTIARLVAEGRPVLVGTRSVGASEDISAVLTARGIRHALLNAKQDDIEAEVIAAAGQASTVTVATNMAGRGTDIALAPGVAERGGLHVILTEFHDSRRVDRQLFGRCARQGDPGSCTSIVSLEDDLYAVYAPQATGLVKRLGGEAALGPISGTARLVHGWLRRMAQRSAERRSKEIRMANLNQDRRLEQTLAFSGRGE